MPIFLIEELWTDSMENEASAAYGYRAIGYIETRERARKICAAAGTSIGTGWPLMKGVSYSNRRLREIPFMDDKERDYAAIPTDKDE